MKIHNAMWIDIKKVKDWELVTEKSVGGLEWVGFSEKEPNKMICISSQKSTVFDCSNGLYEECKAELNEMNKTAVCDKIQNETIKLSGQYGGSIPHATAKGDKVIAETSADYITKVTFISSKKRHIIFKNYGFYTCGFSYDGNYFVFSQDAGITILKRKNISPFGR